MTWKNRNARTCWDLIRCFTINIITRYTCYQHAPVVWMFMSNGNPSVSPQDHFIVPFYWSYSQSTRGSNISVLCSYLRLGKCQSWWAMLCLSSARACSKCTWQATRFHLLWCIFVVSCFHMSLSKSDKTVPATEMRLVSKSVYCEALDRICSLIEHRFCSGTGCPSCRINLTPFLPLSAKSTLSPRVRFKASAWKQNLIFSSTYTEICSGIASLVWPERSAATQVWSFRQM